MIQIGKGVQIEGVQKHISRGACMLKPEVERRVMLSMCAFTLSAAVQSQPLPCSCYRF